MSARVMGILNARPATAFEKSQIDKLIVLVREEEGIKVELFEDRIALLTEDDDTLACAADRLSLCIEFTGSALSWPNITGEWRYREDDTRCRVDEMVRYADGKEAQAIANLTGVAITDDCTGAVYRPKEST